MNVMCGVCGERKVWVSWERIDTWAEIMNQPVDEIRALFRQGLLLEACAPCMARAEEEAEPELLAQMAEAIIKGE